MASFNASLVLGTPGQLTSPHVPRYPVDICTQHMHQDLAARGRPATRPYAGELHLTMLPPANVTLMAWAKNPALAISCCLVFSDLDGVSPSLVLQLENAYCVSYAEHFVTDNSGHVSYFVQLSIAAGQITKHGVRVTNHWNPSH